MKMSKCDSMRTKMKSKDFKKAVLKVIIRKLKSNLKKDKIDSSIRKHLEWRLAYNLYHAGFYAEALEILEKLCGFKLESDSNEDLQYKATTGKRKLQVTLGEISRIHQTAGLCSIARFHETHLHLYLENAYAHYQNSIDTMPLNLYTIFKLPQLLLEFGHILEHYGSFQSALEVYSQILTCFHNTRAYFDAMYRSAIVGRYIANFSEEDDQREEAIEKCIDVFHFLLEAIPPSINELHVVFLYARTLRESQKTSNVLRAGAVMQSLFELCKQHIPPLAQSDVYRSFSDWENEPQVWLHFGRELRDSKEPLIIKEAHNKLLECIALKRSQGIECTEILTPSFYLELAKNSAEFQNYDDAIFFAEKASEQDRYNMEARKLLAKWSRSYKEQFDIEVLAVRTIARVWRHRCWFPGFRKKLKQKVVEEHEGTIKNEPLNMQVRSVLSYYARDRWRAKFLFENQCAKRIQAAYRMARLRWTWQTPIRAAYLERANEKLTQYKMAPYERLIREEIRQIFVNPFCPKNHEILVSLTKLFQDEEIAVSRIVKALRHNVFKGNLRRAISMHKLNRVGLEHKHALKIQCAVRCALARRVMARAYSALREKTAAAIKIQSIYRMYLCYKFLLDMKVVRAKLLTRDKAGNYLARVVPAMISVYRAKCILHQLREEKKGRTLSTKYSDVQNRFRVRQLWEVAIQFAVQITRARSHKNRDRFYNLVLLVIGTSRSRQLSCSSQDLTCALQADHSNHYRPPGLSISSLHFQNTLHQTSMFCDFSFSNIDALMLARVLRHKRCCIQDLTLHQINALHPCFTNDFVPAIGCCRSLRAVRILGGRWSEQTLTKLFSAIQLDNPYIKELVIESLDDMVDHSNALVYSAGLLIADYFNYSTPGIYKLSLHELSIKDSDLDLLVKGLICNRSMHLLYLSNNLISDEGLMQLISALSENSCLCLELLDLRQNLIQGTIPLLNAIRNLFSKIALKSTAAFTLNLVKNPMTSLRDCDIVYRFNLRTVVSINSQEFNVVRESKVQRQNRITPLGQKIVALSSTNPKGRCKHESRGDHRGKTLLTPLQQRSITPGRVKPFLPSSHSS